MMMDWDSDSTHVLINPRVDAKERAQTQKQLLDIKLPSHIWIATSGTSSAQKWAALSKRAILASAKAVNHHLKSDSQDIWLHALPNFHVGGLGIWARAHLSGAGVVEYIGRWDPQQFSQKARQHYITLTALVPTQLYDLVENDLKAPKTLRATVIGGGALNETLYHKAKALGWKPLPSYGMTECCSQIATASLDSLNHDAYPELNILPHITCDTAHDGRLSIKSEALLTTYAWNKEGTLNLTDPKVSGAFITEDVVKIDNEVIVFIGRSSDFVKIGGESVNIARLNTLIEKIRKEENISGDQAVVSVPDDRLGHSIHLAHTSTPTDELERLCVRYHQCTMPFEKIRAFHEVESIPRTALSKLNMKSLKEMLYTV